MNKKGFTIVELLIVITLLSVFIGIFIFSGNKLINKSYAFEEDDRKNILILAVESYISLYPDRLEDLYKGSKYVDITIGELRKDGFLSETLKDKSGNILEDNSYIRITLDELNGNYDYEFID